MAWTKVPEEHHPLFMAALPRDPRISTVRMFGALAAMVNGRMFGGLFARSALVKLSEADQQEALALDGSAPFDPMGNGRVMTSTILLAEEVMDDPQVLRDWLRRAFEYALTLPKKEPKAARSKPAAARSQPGAARPQAKPAVVRPQAKPAVARPQAKPGAARPKAQPGAARSKSTSKRSR